MKVPRLDLTTGEPLRGKALYEAKHRQRYKPEPTTLDDLMERAGPLAHAAKVHVEWGAITVWFMNGDCNGPLQDAGLDYAVANRSQFLVGPALQHESGWPVLSGRAVTPALYGYPTDDQREARLVAAQVHALWEAAGRPHVNARRCKNAYRWLGACNALPGNDDEPNLVKVKDGSAADMLQNFFASF